MPPRLRPAALAALLAVAATPTFADAGSGIDFKFAGFGTVGIVHSTEREGNFVSDPFAIRGPGKDRSWGFEPDTKLGLQVTAQFTEKLSAAVQVLTATTPKGNWDPRLEWANVKYAITPDLSVRLGRTALPAFLISDSRMVGYSQHWIRPPIEVYGVLSVTSNDGIDVNWRSRFGSVTNTVQAYAGSSTKTLREGMELKAKNAWGISDAVEIGSLTLRAGFNTVIYDLTIPAVDSGLYAGLAAIQARLDSIPAFATQARALADLTAANNLHNGKVDSTTLAVSYDPGDWFVMADFVQTKARAFHYQRAYLVSGGARLGKWTPYATIADGKADRDKATIDTTGMPAALATPIQQLVGGINAVGQGFVRSQQSMAFGLRWDVMPSVAVKGQIDRVKTKAGNPGQFVGPLPGAFTNDRTNTIMSLAADFVF